MISINGAAITEDAIEREREHHADAPSPRDAAACALAIRELLLQRARALGLGGAEDAASEDAVIDALIEREVRTPQPAETECLRYYESHRRQFRSGDLVEASHILFAVTPNAPLAAIRAQAESTVKQIVSDPARFEALAAQFSNCPSGAQGGSLGQLGRGDTVPEFEAALFDGDATGVLPRLVNTRYGFHVVCVNRRIEGREVPFELARERIAEFLSESVRRKALQQYLRLLAAQADVSGIDLNAAGSPLLQ
ncbi:MAG: peptidylprolyl isomerase [Betaproteobacteria bacterium]|nr:peptidylprolyl isomerase [Betaproteobacteria bacterium]